MRGKLCVCVCACVCDDDSDDERNGGVSTQGSDLSS